MSRGWSRECTQVHSSLDNNLDRWLEHLPDYLNELDAADKCRVCSKLIDRITGYMTESISGDITNRIATTDNGHKKKALDAIFGDELSNIDCSDVYGDVLSKLEDIEEIDEEYEEDNEEEDSEEENNKNPTKDLDKK